MPGNDGGGIFAKSTRAIKNAGAQACLNGTRTRKTGYRREHDTHVTDL